MKPIILYIHGFNSSGVIFNYISSNLLEHEPVIANYDSMQSIATSINAIKHKELSQKYFIVAHSLGGILAHRIACEDPNVEGLITLSTPFSGCVGATFLRFAFPKLRVMKDLSPFSSSIIFARENAPSCKWMNVVTTAGIPSFIGANDGVVSVKSQRHSAATMQYEINTNHFEVVQHPSVIGAINSFIKGNSSENI